MRTFILFILAVVFTDPKEIAKINAIKKEAEAAYLGGDYELAIAKYTLLTDSLGVDEDEIKLNLGHAHYHLGDSAGAKLNYGKVGGSSNKKLRSIAYQQLGVISKEGGKLEQALEQLKTAVKADPTNMDAIYNYEVVKKLLDQKEQEEQNKDQEDKIEPSEYAKQMKKKSDELRYRGDFQSAYNTMLEAYQKDKTVAAYDDYIKKLQKVLIGEE